MAKSVYNNAYEYMLAQKIIKTIGALMAPVAPCEIRDR